MSVAESEDEITLLSSIYPSPPRRKVMFQCLIRGFWVWVGNPSTRRLTPPVPSVRDRSVSLRPVPFG